MGRALDRIGDWGTGIFLFVFFIGTGAWLVADFARPWAAYLGHAYQMPAVPRLWYLVTIGMAGMGCVYILADKFIPKFFKGRAAALANVVLAGIGIVFCSMLLVISLVDAFMPSLSVPHEGGVVNCSAPNCFVTPGGPSNAGGK